MTVVIVSLFDLGLVFYLVAAAMAVWYWRSTDARVLGVINRLSVAGAIMLLATFASRWLAWGKLPLTSMGDSLNLLILLSTVIVLFVVRAEKMQSLVCIYLPALTAVYVITGVAGREFLREEPRALMTFVLAIHVLSAFLAFSLFFVASMTSVSYVFMTRQLKRRHKARLFQELPSLERMDRLLFKLIRVGYPLFVLTLVQGLVWAWYDSDQLGATWYLSTKVLYSAVTVIFYAFSFHARRLLALRGRKYAYVVFYGFTFLLVAYIVLGLLNVKDYNFWSLAA